LDPYSDKSRCTAHWLHAGAAGSGRADGQDDQAFRAMVCRARTGHVRLLHGSVSVSSTYRRVGIDRCPDRGQYELSSKRLVPLARLETAGGTWPRFLQPLYLATVLCSVSWLPNAVLSLLHSTLRGGELSLHRATLYSARTSAHNTGLSAERQKQRRPSSAGFNRRAIWRRGLMIYSCSREFLKRIQGAYA